MTTDPLSPSALRFAAAGTVLVLIAALVGAAVRLLPWALDPTIAWATLAPFARSLGAVAVEAAILTGWPVGWALASQRLVERGEARVLATLGESPPRTLARLGPQAAMLGALLAVMSVVLGREAAAPGRVVNALVEEGRAACASAETAKASGVPFVSATWLCVPGPAGDAATRLVGRAPIGGIAFTASDAHVSDDLRRVDLEDARLGLAAADQRVHLHVGTLTLRGLPPWARASALPPVLRAIVVTLSALAAACAAVLALLELASRQRRVGGVAAVAVGAAGPLTALAALRGLELRVPDVPALDARWIVAFALVPLAAMAAVVLGALIVAALPEARRTGSK